MSNKYIEEIKSIELFEDKEDKTGKKPPIKSKSLLIDSLEIVIPTKDTLLPFIVSILFSIVFCTLLLKNDSTIILLKDILATFISIYIGLFACILTVYSITVNMFNKTLTNFYVGKNGNGKISKLKEYLTYYEQVSFVYFIQIVTTVLMYIFIPVIDLEYINFIKENFLCNGISIFFLILYFAFSIRCLLEIQSLIYNTLSLSRANTSLQLLELYEEELKKTTEKKGNKK